MTTSRLWAIPESGIEELTPIPCFEKNLELPIAKLNESILAGLRSHECQEQQSLSLSLSRECVLYTWMSYYAFANEPWGIKLSRLYAHQKESRLLLVT